MARPRRHPRHCHLVWWFRSWRQCRACACARPTGSQVLGWCTTIDIDALHRSERAVVTAFPATGQKYKSRIGHLPLCSAPRQAAGIVTSGRAGVYSECHQTPNTSYLVPSHDLHHRDFPHDHHPRVRTIHNVRSRTETGTPTAGRTLRQGVD